MLFHVPDCDHVFKFCAVSILEDRVDRASAAYGAVGGDLGERAGAYDPFGGSKRETGTASAVSCLK